MELTTNNPRVVPVLHLSFSILAPSRACVSQEGHHLGDTEDLVLDATTRLLREQSPAGLWAHVLPARSQPRWRAHVGSFADQVYPLQALARAARLTGSPDALDAANRTAARICSLQGAAGQWWWHYDSRNGQVVEPYPVYSVHQHAMAPMVLLDLLLPGEDGYSVCRQNGR